MTRKPVVAGQFYPSDPAELKKIIEQSFVSEFGPRKLPEKKRTKKISGVVVPHAGYLFSGPGAAWAYKEIADSDFPDVYVIIGVNHSGRETCLSDESWETPLGTVLCDKELIHELSSRGININNDAHSIEHSIEVQLPFLQEVSKDRIDDLRIANIMIADTDFKRWADIIIESLEKLDRKAVFICSSDFTHYGDSFDYTPFDEDIKENMKKLDIKAAKLVASCDGAGLLEYTQTTNATICGRLGMAVLAQIMKKKKKKGQLLNYYTSGDVLMDYSSAVGYATILFR